MPSWPTTHMVKKLVSMPTRSLSFQGVVPEILASSWCLSIKQVCLHFILLIQQYDRCLSNPSLLSPLVFPVAFGLFAGPLFHMWEKLIHFHGKPFWVRTLARLPLCGSMIFLAVAFPFFGAGKSNNRDTICIMKHYLLTIYATIYLSVNYHSQCHTGSIHYLIWNLYHSLRCLQPCI